jgi:hypothetical protein
VLVGLALLGTLFGGLRPWLAPSESERSMALVRVVASQVSGILSSRSPGAGEVQPLLQNLTEPLVVVLPGGGRDELSKLEISQLLVASRRGSRVILEPKSLVASLDENKHRAEISGDLELREELVEGGERLEQRRFRAGLRRAEDGWKVAAVEVTAPLVEQPEARP